MALIIVVDDDATICSLLRDALEMAGHTVRVAADGDECLASIAAARPDMVITDIFMPGKEGIETICEIHDRWPEIKIIAMSSGGSLLVAVDFLSLAEGLGADQILRKPFSIRQALQMVEKLLLAPGR